MYKLSFNFLSLFYTLLCHLKLLVTLFSGHWVRVMVILSIRQNIEKSENTTLNVCV